MRRVSVASWLTSAVASRSPSAAELELADVAAAQPAGRMLQLRDDAEVVLGPVREDHERLRLAAVDEIGEEHRAVGIAPVGVVDEDHQRAHPRELAEQRAQRLEAAPAQLAAIAHRRPRRASANRFTRFITGNSRTSAARSRGAIVSTSAGGSARITPVSDVDHAVEHLEWHLLALEAAPLEDDRPTRRASARTSAPARVLPMPRLALDHHRDAAAPAVGERTAELVELVAPADERHRHRRARHVARARRRRRAELIEDRHAGRARARPSAASSIIASRDRSAGRPATMLLGLGGSSVCLRVITCSLSPSNGRRPTSASYSMQPTEYQSLASLSVWSLACSGDMYTGVPTASRSGLVSATLRDQAEVEQREPAERGDQHVRRLEIAVQLAGLVQREQRVDELDQRAAQPLLVNRRREDVLARARRAARLRRAHPVDERHALDELHREVPVALGGVQLVQRDEVRMHDVGERAELALEPVQVAARRRGAAA